uniref:Protein CobW n=1 Tax=Stylophora pistillata TaxID=50429 RepID=A0A2B4R1D0_STYPI
MGMDGTILKGAGCDCGEENIVELSNGCICCTVQEEFLPAMLALMKRRDSIDHIIIETSGLALPKPLVKAFQWPDLKTQITVDAVVTLVDCVGQATGAICDRERVQAQRIADENLDHETSIEELFEDQLSCADLLVMTKCDLEHGVGFKIGTTSYYGDIENWSRPKSEVDVLMGLIVDVAKKEYDNIQKQGSIAFSQEKTADTLAKWMRNKSYMLQKLSVNGNKVFSNGKPDSEDISSLYQNSGYLFSNVDAVETDVKSDSIGQKSQRIGYIDLEYILLQIPGYKKAQEQILQRAQKWRTQISASYKELKAMQQQLSTDEPLLTPSLISMRKAAIKDKQDQITSFIVNAQKIAHIDFQELVTSMPESKKLNADLEKLSKTYQEEIKAAQTKLQAKLEKYRAEQNSQTVAQNDERNKEIQEENLRLQKLIQTAEQDIARKRNEGLKPIVEKATKAVDKVAKTKGIQYVLQKGAVVYAGGLDLLSAVKKELGIK